MRSSRGLVGLAGALALGACGDGLEISVNYRVIGLAAVTDGACGPAPTTPPVAAGATRVRFTFRDHTPTGPGPLRCDVVLPRGVTDPVLAVPRRSEPVDLWVEYFDDGGALVARGETRDVDLRSGTATLYTAPSSGYACEPVQPQVPRAFHTATLLPTGEVLFLGGLTDLGAAGAEFSPTAGAYVTVAAEIYDPASGRVFPVAITGFAPRAFHHVVVLGTDVNGDVRLAVTGGLGVSGDASAVGNVAAIGGAAGEAPWREVAADAGLGRSGSLAVPAEMLVYSPTTRTIARTPITGVGGAAFASEVVDDRDHPTPRVIGGGAGPGGDALDALTPAGEPMVRLTGVPRIGAAVVASGPTTALWIGGDLGSTRLYDTITQLDTTPGLSPGPAPPAVGLNRAFGAGVRLDDELLYVGGLRILMNAITDTTGAIPGVRVDLTADVPTELTAPELTPTAYLAAAQLPRHGALVSGGAVAGNSGCLGTLACVSSQSVRFDAAAVATATAAPGLPRYGHRLTRLDNGVVLVSGGFVPGATPGTLRATAVLERFEPHTAVDDPLADVGPARAPGEVAMTAGAPAAPCALVTGVVPADAAIAVDAAVDAEPDADIDAM